jgi:hypothetical protein
MYIVVCAWIVFHHPTELMLSSAQQWLFQCLLKGEDGKKVVAGGGVRRTSLLTRFPLQTVGKLHSFQNMYEFIEWNWCFLFSFLNIYLSPWAE